MHSIKELIYLLACIMLLLAVPKNVLLSEEDDFVIKIKISGSNEEYVVEIFDDPYYAEKEPIVFVNTDIEGDKARVIDENDKEIPCVLVDGEVSFGIDKGGTYYITKGTQNNTAPEEPRNRTTTPVYVPPKTGVEQKPLITKKRTLA